MFRILTSSWLHSEVVNIEFVLDTLPLSRRESAQVGAPSILFLKTGLECAQDKTLLRRQHMILLRGQHILLLRGQDTFKKHMILTYYF